MQSGQIVIDGISAVTQPSPAVLARLVLVIPVVEKLNQLPQGNLSIFNFNSPVPSLLVD